MSTLRTFGSLATLDSWTALICLEWHSQGRGPKTAKQGQNRGYGARCLSAQKLLKKPHKNGVLSPDNWRVGDLFALPVGLCPAGPPFYRLRRNTSRRAEGRSEGPLCSAGTCQQKRLRPLCTAGNTTRRVGL